MRSERATPELSPPPSDAAPMLPLPRLDYLTPIGIASSVKLSRASVRHYNAVVELGAERLRTLPPPAP